MPYKAFFEKSLNLFIIPVEYSVSWQSENSIGRG